MEQVDQIILVTLRELGVALDDEITSLGHLSDALVVRSVARCLNTIRGGSAEKIPESLPGNMAMKYRVGIQLANSCKELGYKADLGYETFLYASEVEIRRLLMFLVERLPRSHGDQEARSGSPTKSSLRASISREFQRQLAQPWLPPDFHPKGTAWDPEAGVFTTVSGYRPFVSSPLSLAGPVLSEQCGREELLCSLLALSTRLHCELDVASTTPRSPDKQRSGRARELLAAAAVESATSVDDVITSSRAQLGLLTTESPHRISVTQARSALPSEGEEAGPTESVEQSEEELLAEQGAEVAELEGQVEGLAGREREMRSKIDAATAKLDGLAKERTEKEGALEALGAEYALKKRTLQLVPTEENPVTMMREKLAAVQKETSHVKDMWVTRESEFRTQVEELRAEVSAKEQQTAEFIGQIREMRTEVGELAAALDGKEEEQQELERQVGKLGNKINRNAHTRKILDTVERIKRQKEQIEKILSDTRVVQKEINSLNGKIERSFIETDELIFRDAKHNDQCKQAYKLLANLQSEFNALVRALDDIGTINREVRDLEDMLVRESDRKVREQISKVEGDLATVAAENKKLASAIERKG